MVMIMSQVNNSKKDIIIEITNLNERINKANHYYRENLFYYCKFECQSIIEDLLRQISTQLCWEYRDVSKFVLELEEKKQTQDFIFYKNLKKFSETLELCKDVNNISKEYVEFLLSEVVEIFLKLGGFKNSINNENNSDLTKTLGNNEKRNGSNPGKNEVFEEREKCMSKNNNTDNNLKKYLDKLIKETKDYVSR